MPPKLSGVLFMLKSTAYAILLKRVTSLKASSLKPLDMLTSASALKVKKPVISEEKETTIMFNTDLQTYWQTLHCRPHHGHLSITTDCSDLSNNARNNIAALSFFSCNASQTLSCSWSGNYQAFVKMTELKIPEGKPEPIKKKKQTCLQPW